ELVAAAAPFGLLLAVGLSATAPGAVDVRTDEAEIRTLEGDTACFTQELLASGAALPALRVEMHTPAGLRAAVPARVVRLAPGHPVAIAVDLSCARWGGYLAGGMTLRTPGPLGLVHFEQVVEPSVRVRVYPTPEAVRAVPRPA